ncbi:MAG: PAS domain-containing protein, partial [Bacteroidia bacterium]|nr:PAS domain-containing protein [Bacteroidia bacterium]
MSATTFLERFFQPSETLMQFFRDKVREAHYELWFQGKEPRYVVGLWVGLERGDSIFPTRFMLVFQDATDLEKSRQNILQYAEELKQQIDAVESLLQEKLRIEKSLQESHIFLSLFQSASDHLREGVILLEEEGKVLWANTSAHQLLETSPKKLIGLSYPQLPPPLAAMFSEVSASGAPTQQELRLSAHSPWITVQVQPLSFSDKIEDKRFFVITLEPIQEKKLYQEVCVSLRAHWEAMCQAVLTQSVPTLRSLKLWQKGMGVFPIVQKPT